MYHNPVLIQESVEFLITNQNGTYVDLTFGGGGHSRLILSKLGDNGRLYAMDQDNEAEEQAKALKDDPRFVFIRGNFRFVKNFLNYNGVKQVDGILADLGVSSHQFDTPERGFSFRFTSPLDMRMNCKSTLTASNLINNASEDKLSFIFTNYGELKNGKSIARRLVQHRNIQQIETTAEFLTIVADFIPMKKGEKDKQYTAQLFQALRIFVNDELGALQEMLYQSGKLLHSNGRLVAITYHSLEDRLVKNYIKSGTIEGEPKKDLYGNMISPMKSLLKKPLTPTTIEMESNRRSRSAKLRVGVKS